MKITAAHSISKHVCQEITNMDSTGRPGRAANIFTLLNTFKKPQCDRWWISLPFPVYVETTHNILQQAASGDAADPPAVLWKTSKAVMEMPGPSVLLYEGVKWRRRVCHSAMRGHYWLLKGSRSCQFHRSQSCGSLHLLFSRSPWHLSTW